MPVPVGPFRVVGQLIEFFVFNGCVLNELPWHLEGPDGEHPVRYLYSPVTDDFVSLGGLDNSDLIPPSIYENWSAA
jgi:hypothetical protein